MRYDTGRHKELAQFFGAPDITIFSSILTQTTYMGDRVCEIQHKQYDDQHGAQPAPASVCWSWTWHGKFMSSFTVAPPHVHISSSSCVWELWMINSSDELRLIAHPGVGGFWKCMQMTERPYTFTIHGIRWIWMLLTLCRGDHDHIWTVRYIIWFTRMTIRLRFYFRRPGTFEWHAMINTCLSGGGHGCTQRYGL